MLAKVEVENPPAGQLQILVPDASASTVAAAQPTSTDPAVAAPPATPELIERYAKTLSDLTARVAAIEAQMITVVFAHFTVIGVGLAFAGFWLTRASAERVAGTVLVSTHYSVFFGMFLTGFLVFALAAGATLVCSAMALVTPGRALAAADRAMIVGPPAAGKLTPEEFVGRLRAMGEDRRAASLEQAQYAYYAELVRKQRWRAYAFSCLAVQVVSFIVGAYGAALILLSGH